MSKHSSSKKQRHNSTMEVPFTQRTAHFPHSTEENTVKWANRTGMKPPHQKENTPLNTRFLPTKPSDHNFLYLGEDSHSSLRKPTGKENEQSLKKIVRNCLKELKSSVIRQGPQQDWQRRIERLVEMKLESMVEPFMEKYLKKHFQIEKEAMANIVRMNEQQITAKIATIERNYDHVLQTYDSFLKIVQTIKTKPPKPDTRKKDIDIALANTNEDIRKMQQSISSLSQQLQELKKSQPKTVVQPLMLNYDEGQTEMTREELQIVVATYNQNFRQIDQKLKELYSYISEYEK